MSLWRHFKHGFRVLANRTSADRELDDEIQHYVDQMAAEYRDRGLTAAQARREAVKEIGSSTALREQVRDYGWETLVGTWLADIRFAGRMLRKSPVFSVVVVLVISLGSGAVSTIFSAMNALVLRPLPGIGRDSGLVTLQPARRDGTVAQQGSYAYYAYLREKSRSLNGLAAWGRVSLSIAAGGQGTAVLGNMVSSNYFEVLEVSPALGRFFTPDEERAPGVAPVIVVSHAFWSSRLGGESTAIGRTVIVNGTPFTVIGVAPEDFQGLYTGMRAEAWVPLMMQPQLRPRSNLTSASWLWLFGRLADGFSLEAARQELSVLTAAHAVDSTGNAGRTPFDSIRLARLTGLPNGETGMLLGFMGLLLGAAGLVLLISGVNVAAMLSARYLARQREISVRAALGANRLRLLRQLLTEVLCLFLLGALGGFLVAFLATAALERLPLPETIPVSLELSPDVRVLAFAVGTSLLAGLIFGLAPALQAARKEPAPQLRVDQPAGGMRRSLLSRGLIVAQLALSLVLLVTAGLFLRALNQGRGVDPGFAVSDVATAALQPESWGYDETRTREFYLKVREVVEGLPGVEAMSFTSRLPLMMGYSPDDMEVDDGTEMSIHTAAVGVDYFSVLRLPLLQGREFVPSDTQEAPPVAVVNETLARRAWPDGNPIGQTFRFRDRITSVVGIARDAKYAYLDETTPAFAYFPLSQIWQPTQSLLVRTATDPNSFLPAIEKAVLSIDPLLPRPGLTTLKEVTAIVLLPQRAAAIVTGVLGGVGLVLAAVGLYGIMAFSAGRRTHEIGIRMALGAERSSVLRLIIREGMRLAGLGILLGLMLAAAAARLIEGWLFEVSTLDLPAFLGMSAIFLAVASIASYLPARRAASLNPLRALRTD